MKDRAFVLAAAFGLIALFMWALNDEVLPTEEDCIARGQAVDCWKQSNSSSLGEIKP